MRHLSAALAAAIAFVPMAANGDSGQVVASGTIGEVCAIEIVKNGKLIIDRDANVLETSGTGASSAQLNLEVEGTGLKFSVPPPLAWKTQDSIGDDTFVSRYGGFPGVLEQNGENQTNVGPGSYSVWVDLYVTRTSGPFLAGSYTAEITALCEQ